MTNYELMIVLLEYELKTCEDCKYCVKKQCQKGHKVRKMCGDICSEFTEQRK